MSISTSRQLLLLPLPCNQGLFNDDVSKLKSIQCPTAAIVGSKKGGRGRQSPVGTRKTTRTSQTTGQLQMF